MQATYFWSGSNHAGEIDGILRNGRSVGVTIDKLDHDGRAVERLLAMRETPRVRVIGSVARNSSGKPMVFLTHGRALLPQGDASVEIGGNRVVASFRKIAVNVARSNGSKANVLGDRLRDIFGDAAGQRGREHKVAIELTRVGWRMRKARLAELQRGAARVFVDSGAFSEVALNKPSKGKLPFSHQRPFSWVAVRPIDHAEWTRRLDAMTEIAETLGERAYLVAPDRVGSQAKTLRRLQRYAHIVRRWRKAGARPIVALQKGRLSQLEFDRECTRILGFSDYVRGIPSNKAAATPEEIGELVQALPAGTAIHLLGIGPRSARWEETVAYIPDGYELSCDSAGIPSLVGRTNGKRGGRRILTKLRDQICRQLGYSNARTRDPRRTARIKALMMDRYFTLNPDAA